MYLTRYAPANTLLYVPARSPAEIFALLRDDRGWGYREAARAAGVSVGSIQRLENGSLNASNVTGKVVSGAARAYGLTEQTVLDILAGKFSEMESIGDKLESLRRQEVASEWVAVPIYGVISAGDADPEPSWAEHAVIPREVDGHKLRHLDRIRTYRVNGNCMVSEETMKMRKSYVHGDLIVVDPTKGYQEGDVVAAWWEERQIMVLKRYKYERENILLYPAAPGHPSIELPHEDMVHILGPVVYRGG